MERKRIGILVKDRMSGSKIAFFIGITFSTLFVYLGYSFIRAKKVWGWDLTPNSAIL